jgi:hypothetical protein
MNKELKEYLDVPDWDKNVQISEDEAPKLEILSNVVDRQFLGGIHR